MSRDFAAAMKATAHWSRSALLGACLASAPAVLAAQTLTMEAVNTEAREGRGNGIELLLKLDAPAEFPFMVQVELAGVDAQSGADFTPPVIPVTFDKHDILKRAAVNIVDDPLDEPYRETFIASVGRTTPLDPEAVPNVINAAASIPLTVIDDDNAFSVTAAPGREGEAVILTIRQEYDSETEEVISASPGEGSAIPGADFEPWVNYAHFPPGAMETTIDIGLLEDSLPEGDETFPIELTHMGTGTASFDPAQVTGKILDTTEEDTTENGTQVMVEGGPITTTIEVMGHTTTRQTDYAPYKATLTRHIGGSRMTLIQPDRMNMEFRRICMENADFEAIAEGMPGLSVADVGAGNRTGWRGEYVDGSYAQVWTMFEGADGRFSGYTRIRDDIDGAKMRGWESWTLTPLQEEAPEVARLPPEEPAAQLPPGAVTDAVARAVADDLGMSPEDVGPYLSTSLGPDMTRGDGDTARAVVVEIWLDAEGRPLRADRVAPGPCDQGYGEARPAAKRLRYRLGTAGDAIIGQAAVQDVETGVFEQAYMEDLGDASNDLDTAAERAHDGLSPDVSAPE